MHVAQIIRINTMQSYRVHSHSTNALIAHAIGLAFKLVAGAQLAYFSLTHFLHCMLVITSSLSFALHAVEFLK